MSEKYEDIYTLEAEIEKSIKALIKIEIFYNELKELINDRSDTRNAITLSEIIVNYYTCLETVFFRISSFFENNLSKERWHSELLHKMTLHIKGIREPVISDQSYKILDEFRRFRHFKRYYFDFAYDWDRLEFLQKKFDILIANIKNDLNSFIEFLNNLNNNAEHG